MDSQDVERNAIRAFHKVKEDIVALQKEILALGKEQEKIIKMLEAKSVKKVAAAKPKVKKTTKKVAKRTSRKAPKQFFIASNEGTKYFEPGSIGAQRIKKENQVVFKTQEAALKAGYKPAKRFN